MNVSDPVLEIREFCRHAAGLTGQTGDLPNLNVQFRFVIALLLGKFCLVVFFLAGNIMLENLTLRLELSGFGAQRGVQANASGQQHWSTDSTDSQADPEQCSDGEDAPGQTQRARLALIWKNEYGPAAT